MGFRLSKRIKIVNNLKLNLSKSGISLSIGRPGLSMNLGKKGTFFNIGIPGSGVSFREKLDKTKDKHSFTQMEISLKINDDGTIIFVDNNENELPPSLVKKIKACNKELIKSKIKEYIQKQNFDYESCLSTYKYTPKDYTSYFPLSPPEKPVLTKISFFKNIVGMAESEKNSNQLRNNLYEEKMQKWTSQKKCWPVLFQKAETGDANAMELLLEIVFTPITWPKETLISFDFSNENKTLVIDIDFPEIEMTPTSFLSCAAREIKINVKKLNDSQIKHNYATLVHGTLFRVIGECFSALPYLVEIIASGFTQRISKETGIETDEYILSVKVQKTQWEKINLSSIEAIDPIEALNQFQLIRDMKRNYELKKILLFNLSNK